MIYYYMYSEYEEKYGLFNHAIEILDRMSDEVIDDDKQRAYEIFIAKVANYLGLTRTRPIFEKALENFKDKNLTLFGLRYAQVERKLGETDRARQIMNYLSSLVDPELDSHRFWESWEEFEMSFGNEDTYKEMMRVKRTVESKYSILPPTFEKIQMKLNKEIDQDKKIEETNIKFEEEIRKTKVAIEE
jgi:pre-mRNA-splicing factor SYF1